MTVPRESPQLDYAPRAPKAWRAPVYRWLIIAVTLLTVYFCRHWPIETWRHFRVLSLQSQCLKHPIPPGTIVYSSGTPQIAVVPPQWGAFVAADPKGFRWTSAQITSIVFMGELTASNGMRRFVEVEAHTNWKPRGFSDVMFFTRSIELGLTTPLRENFQPAGGPTCNADPRWTRTLPDIAVYAAAVDRGDPSHISFRCRIFQEDYLVDGCLGTDGSFTLDKWNCTTLPLNAQAR